MAPHQSQHNIKSQYENMRQHHSQSSLPPFFKPQEIQTKTPSFKLHTNTNTTINT